MTGSGSARVAWSLEETYRELADVPTWTQPGLDVSVGSASLENQLQRARQPDDPRPAGSREGNLEGALNVSFSLTDDNYHELTFANDTTDGLATSAALAPSATWYLSAELPGNTEERILEGACVTSWSISYTQGEKVTVDLTIVYAYEYDPADADAPDVPADGAINQPAKDDIIMFHGVDFDLNATNVSKLQSLSVDISNMARPRRGQSRLIQDMVVGAYEPSLSFEAVLDDTGRRELAYGSSGATKPSVDTIDDQTATLTLGSLGDYTLSGVQPNTYEWSQLVESEDTTDPVEAQFTDFSEAA